MFVVVLAGIGAVVGTDVWFAFGDDALAVHTEHRTGTCSAASFLPARLFGGIAVQAASVFQAVDFDTGGYDTGTGNAGSFGNSLDGCAVDMSA